MIINQRCVSCHSETPTFAGLKEPPSGVVLEKKKGYYENSERYL